MFECVVNISEGRDLNVLEQLTRASGASLRDRHRDRHHNRSVFTLISDEDELLNDLHDLVRTALQRIDLRNHRGEHPRFGVVDVVPFVALAPEPASDACRLRDVTAAWLAESFAVPVFLYGILPDGSVRTLPEVRRDAFTALSPDAGPDTPSPIQGAVAVGCRPILVAWNLWLTGVTLERARDVAARLRGPAVRCLAFAMGEEVQVSCNLVDLDAVRPSQVYDRVLEFLAGDGGIERAELVGLAPISLLGAEDERRWGELGLSVDATIETRLAN